MSALVRTYGSPVVPVPVTVTVVLPLTTVSDPSAPVLVRIYGSPVVPVPATETVALGFIIVSDPSALAANSSASVANSVSRSTWFPPVAGLVNVKILPVSCKSCNSSVGFPPPEIILAFNSSFNSSIAA